MKHVVCASLHDHSSLDSYLQNDLKTVMTSRSRLKSRERRSLSSSSSRTSEYDESTGSFSEVKCKQINIKWIGWKCQLMVAFEKNHTV
jgi:hypothetical protein